MKLRHSELACHQKGLMQQLREFWKEGHLCDVVLKSIDGIEHPVHRNVLSAASAALKALLCAPFREAEQIRQGKPVEMAASGGVVGAFVDYIYGGEPDVATVDAVELLRLAGAYGLPCLAEAVEAELRSSLDSQLALQLLQQTVIWGMPDLRTACEEQVAKDFQQCTLRQDFLKLTAKQLQRILQRTDLNVSREEVVVEALLKWAKCSEDRQRDMVLMRSHVDFPSLSSSNLHVLCHAAQSLGPSGADWECEVKEALSLHRKRTSSEDSTAHRPKMTPSIKVPSSSVISVAGGPRFCLANPARGTFGLWLAEVLLSTGSNGCSASGALPCRPMGRWLLGILTKSMENRNYWHWASRTVWERSCLTAQSCKVSVVHPMGWFML